MTTEHERHERLTLAMVATEAAMAREQNPARYARLERRNRLLGIPPESLAALVVDVESQDDSFWRNDVEAGLWTPTADFSNCLAPSLPLTRLWAEWNAVVDGVYINTHPGRTSQLWVLPRDGKGLEVCPPKPFFVQCVLTAHGGTVALGIGGPEVGAKNAGISGTWLYDGTSFSVLVPPNSSVFAASLAEEERR